MAIRRALGGAIRGGLSAFRPFYQQQQQEERWDKQFEYQRTTAASTAARAAAERLRTGFGSQEDYDRERQAWLEEFGDIPGVQESHLDATLSSGMRSESDRYAQAQAILVRQGIPVGHASQKQWAEAYRVAGGDPGMDLPPTGPMPVGAEAPIDPGFVSMTNQVPLDPDPLGTIARVGTDLPIDRGLTPEFMEQTDRRTSEYLESKQAEQEELRRQAEITAREGRKVQEELTDEYFQGGLDRARQMSEAELQNQIALKTKYGKDLWRIAIQEATYGEAETAQELHKVNLDVAILQAEASCTPSTVWEYNTEDKKFAMSVVNCEVVKDKDGHPVQRVTRVPASEYFGDEVATGLENLAPGNAAWLAAQSSSDGGLFYTVMNVLENRPADADISNPQVIESLVDQVVEIHPGMNRDLIRQQVLTAVQVLSTWQGIATGTGTYVSPEQLDKIASEFAPTPGS